MQCSSAQGKMQSPLFSVAMQNRLTAGSVSLQSLLWSFALHTGVQGASKNALHLCSRQNAIPIVQCCPAKQAQSRQCDTAITPMEFCSSYRCAGSQHKCSAAFVQGKMQSPLFSVALQNRLKAGSVTLQSHLWSFALHTGVQ